jgi:hypothetical protein
MYPANCGGYSGWRMRKIRDAVCSKVEVVSGSGLDAWRSVLCWGLWRL